MNNKELEIKLSEDYNQFLENSIDQRRFKHQDLVRLLNDLRQDFAMDISVIGKSVEERSIHLVKIGHGPVTVLLWSQMHGDEATATMALLDIFNFFSREDKYDQFRNDITSNLSLYIVPMLNPDGAEVFQRRNALEVDLNRDALQLQCPEAKILKKLRDEINADFGFNLHDMDTRYTVGNSEKPATISFLAPPYDPDKSVNATRLRAMKLISLLNKKLQKFIPGQIGKWSDEFEPRAFGDNIQKWGTSTILVESGGYKNDPEKQEIRKLNFILLLSAFNAIVRTDYEVEKEEDYHKIEDNGKYLYDLIIRNISCNYQGHPYTMDIAYNREEITISDSNLFYRKSKLEDIGDLSVFFGYEELDGTGLEVFPGKTSPDILNSTDDLNIDKVITLLKNGYTEVKVKQEPDEKFTHYPITILHKSTSKNNNLKLETNPNLILKKGPQIVCTVVNGFLYNFDERVDHGQNGLIE